MEITKLKKSRASSSEAARQYRKQGHDDALAFARLIGLKDDYKRDQIAKKDVIDLAGDAHSVKSGSKKWQIFLYSRSRFNDDDFFKFLNGMGQLLIDCIDSFPPKYETYKIDKQKYKNSLRTHMRSIAEKLQDKNRLRAFISKSMFNGEEVNYLTIKDNGIYYIYWANEVAQVFSDNLEVTNSKALHISHTPEQKVIFKYKGVNLAELEMRNDPTNHYREIRFNMYKNKALLLLNDVIVEEKKINNELIVRGKAIKYFVKW